MLALLIFMWIISAILWFSDRKTEHTRWLSRMTFFCGLGGLAIVIRENIIPNLEAYTLATNILTGISSISSSMSHYFSPFLLLIYSLSFSEMLRPIWKKHRTAIVITLMVPIFYMYFNYPVLPDFKTSYSVLSIWATIYVFTANFLIIQSFVGTVDQRVKQQKLLTSVIIVPTTFISLVTNYLLPVYNIKNAYEYNTWLIFFQFVSFIYFAIRQGALGIKLTLEKNSMDIAMKAITSGTLLLSHTIKNEVYKIAMCTENIKSSTSTDNCSSLEHADINENIDIVKQSIAYLEIMIGKILNRIGDLTIEKREHSVGSVIENAINIVSPIATAKNIKIQNGCVSRGSIFCDAEHTIETIRNILCNSVEALDSDDCISVTAKEDKRGVQIIIEDNGPGIPKECLSRVIEPFFSTKEKKHNFGLGLTYCYSVMQQHGGRMDISSEEGKGTKTVLVFPTMKTQNVFLRMIVRQDA